MSQRLKDDTRSLLILIGRNLLNANVNFMLPTKYYDKVHNEMVTIRTYLFKEYEASVIQVLYSMEQ